MRLVFIVAAIIAGMYGIDKFLALQERNELLADAQRLYQQGERLMRAGKAHEAAAAFGQAHALERANVDYELALASAQLADHNTDRALQTLNDLLESNSNDARANLLMARAMVAQDKIADADSFYHRAIYGTWAANANQQAAAARLELAGLLAKHGNKEGLLSELLLIQNQPGTDNKKLAELFLEAGSPARAADVYRGMIRDNPTEVDAYAGLAQAEMQRGDYGGARTALRQGLRISSGDDSLRAEEELVDRLATLDPTPRRLSTAEKFARSQEILTLVTNELSACSATPAGEQSALAATSKPKTITNELSESVLAEAEHLWRTRAEVCKQAPVPSDPLPLLMKKLAL